MSGAMQWLQTCPRPQCFGRWIFLKVWFPTVWLLNHNLGKMAVIYCCNKAKAIVVLEQSAEKHFIYSLNIEEELRFEVWWIPSVSRILHNPCTECHHVIAQNPTSISKSTQETCLVLVEEEPSSVKYRRPGRKGSLFVSVLIALCLCMSGTDGKGGPLFGGHYSRWLWSAQIWVLDTPVLLENAQGDSSSMPLPEYDLSQMING